MRLPRNKPEAARYQPRAGDSPEMARWRQRMATDEAKAIYQRRGSLAEWANAQLRNKGMSQFTVRGLPKVTAVAVLLVVTQNLLRWIALGT